MAAEVLTRLYYLTNNPKYRERAKDTLRAFAGGAEPPGIRAAGYALALDFLLNPPPHVVIIGRRSASETQALWRAALKAYRPGKIVAAYDPDEVRADALPPAVATAVKIGKLDPRPKTYVCVGLACSLPTTDPKKVADLIKNFGKKPIEP